MSFEELKEITEGIISGNTYLMLNKLSEPKLVQFKEVITKEKELSLSELDNVKAGIPVDLVEEMKNEIKIYLEKCKKGR